MYSTREPLVYYLKFDSRKYSYLFIQFLEVHTHTRTHSKIDGNYEMYKKKKHLRRNTFDENRAIIYYYCCIGIYEFIHC